MDITKQMEITKNIDISIAAVKAGNEATMKYLTENGMTKRIVHLLIAVDESTDETHDYGFYNEHGNVIQRFDEIENESILVYCKNNKTFIRNIKFDRRVAVYLPTNAHKSLNRLAFTHVVSENAKTIILDKSSIVQSWLRDSKSRDLDNLSITIF